MNTHRIIFVIAVAVVCIVPLRTHAAAVWRVEVQDYEQPPQIEATWWQQWGGYLFGRAAYPRPAIGTVFTVTSSGYASSPYQTDDTPCITAAGTRVRPGVVASNFLPIGTVLEIAGEQYIVEDRMNARYQGYFIDIWFPATSDALEHGRRKLEIKIIGYGVAGQEIRKPEQAAQEEQFAEPGLLQRAGLRVLGLSRSLGNYLGATVDPDRFDVDCFATDIDEL